MSKTLRCIIKAWFIWIIAAAFYSYEFFVRISPTVMVPQLMGGLGVDAAVLGTLSAYYYYVYAILQIPAGGLLDRFGVKVLLMPAAGMVALGCFLLSHAHQLWVAELARVLMGCGSAFSFVGCLKLASNWFKSSQFPLMVGLTNMVGVLGAIIGEAPLSTAVHHLGWREAMTWAAVVGVVIACLIVCVIDDEPISSCKEEMEAEAAPHASGFWVIMKALVKSPQAWLAAIFGGLMVAPISGFAELWAVPFFSKAYHLPDVSAAKLSSFIFVGIAVGGPFHGWLAGKLPSRKWIMGVGAFFALVCLATIVYVAVPKEMEIGTLLFFFGFFTSSMLLVFSISRDYHPLWMSGILIAFINTLIMLAGTFFQPFIGFLLDHLEHLSGKYNALSALPFTTVDFRMSFSSLLFCIVLALILLPFLKEKKS